MKKAYTLLELTITVFLIATLIVATSFFGKETKKNNLKGAQLSLMKLYEAEQLYYKDHKVYTQDLNKIWEYHKKVYRYPVTIVDVRKRVVDKHKEPIQHLRIDHYYIDIKTSEQNQKFIITAKVPVADDLSKDWPIFTINQDKVKTPSNTNLWTIE